MTKTRILCIGETGLGTVYHRSHTFDGLAVALDQKKNGGIDAIIFDGPVVPRIPRKWGRIHEQHLAALLTDEDGKKLQSLEDAVGYSRKEMKMLLDMFKGVPKFYTLSDTDQGNLDDMKMDLLDERKTRENEVIDDLEGKIALIKKRIEDESGYVKELMDYHQILLAESIDGNKPDEENKAQITRVIIDMLGETRIKKILKIEDISTIEAKHLPELISGLKESIGEQDLQLRKVEKNLGARGAALSSYLSPLHPVVDSEMMQELAAQAMLEYEENIIFNILGRENLEILVGRGDDITVNGVRLRVAHNENPLSKTALVTDIARRASSDKSRHVLGIGEAPDVSISSHHAGGWRFYRQRKNREKSETTDYLHLPTLHDQELLEMAKQAGIRNIDTNRWERKERHGFSSGVVILEVDNETGKRSYEFLGLSYLRKLGDLGAEIEGLVRERQRVYSRISKAKKEGSPVDELVAERERLGESIRKKKEEIPVAAERNYRFIKVRGDAHIGSATSPGETSSRALLRADTRYTVGMMKDTGMTLDIMIEGGDTLHGVTVGQNGKVEDYSGLTRMEKEELLEDQLSRVFEAGAKEEKDIEVAKLAELRMRLDDTIPILTVKDQLSVVSEESLELPRLVLENGGYYGPASGSHFNDMFDGHFDEAYLIKSMLPKEYHNRIFVFPGVSQGSGRYIIPTGVLHPKLQELVGDVELPGRDLGGRFDIYMCHKVKAAQDDVLAGMMNVISVNWANEQDVTTGLAAFFHRHHPGGGGLGGCGKSKIVIAGAGMQPNIPYTAEIGKQPSDRGTIHLYMNPDKEVYKIEIIDEEVLEKSGFIARELPQFRALPQGTQ